MWICLIKIDVLECREKKSEFGLGSAFFGISEVGCLPGGVQIKGVIEKGWNFDKNVFLKNGRNLVSGVH